MKLLFVFSILSLVVSALNATFNQFLMQYAVIALDAIPTRNEVGDPVQAKVKVEKLVEALQLDQSEYVITQKRIFYTSEVRNKLVDKINEIIASEVKQLQLNVRKYLSLQKWFWWKLFKLLDQFLTPDQSQMEEFQEAFNMIDQNRDGIIDTEDLGDMLQSLGVLLTEDKAEAIVMRVPSVINFSMFLTMFGDMLNDVNSIAGRQFFIIFDEDRTDQTRSISVEKLRELLTTMGNRLTTEEFDEMLNYLPVDDGSVHYTEFVQIMESGY